MFVLTAGYGSLGLSSRSLKTGGSFNCKWGSKKSKDMWSLSFLELFSLSAYCNVTVMYFVLCLFHSFCEACNMPNTVWLAAPSNLLPSISHLLGSCFYHLEISVSLRFCPFTLIHPPCFCVYCREIQSWSLSGHYFVSSFEVLCTTSLLSSGFMLFVSTFYKENYLCNSLLFLNLLLILTGGTPLLKIIGSISIINN